jgi:hypothetical protein
MRSLETMTPEERIARAKKAADGRGEEADGRTARQGKGGEAKGIGEESQEAREQVRAIAKDELHVLSNRRSRSGRFGKFQIKNRSCDRPSTACIAAILNQLRIRHVEWRPRPRISEYEASAA